MNKPNLSKLFKDLGVSISKHSPEILTGIGIAGMITSTVLAVKATPRAIDLIKNAENEKQEELTKVECVKAAWKCYIPAAATGVLSTACLVGASAVNYKRNAALAAAYALSDSTLRKYHEKVVETIGEKKERVVRDKISEENLRTTPIGSNEVILTDKGDTLFYEPISGRYFKSAIEKVKRAENDLNKSILSDAFNTGVSLNDFYESIGLSKTGMGENVGWSLDIGMIDIYLSAQIVCEECQYEGQPCLVINFTNPPKYDF